MYNLHIRIHRVHNRTVTSVICAVDVHMPQFYQVLHTADGIYTAGVLQEHLHNTGEIHSNTGEIHSNTGHICSNIEHIYSNIRHSYSNTGYIYSNTGHIYSKTGHIYSNTGYIYSNTTYMEFLTPPNSWEH